MAISLVGTATTATGSDGSGVITIDKPTGVAEGDVLVAYLHTSSGSLTSNDSLFSALWATSGNGGFQSTGWYRIAGASEPSTYSWTRETTSSASVQGATMVAFRGLDPYSPLNYSHSQSTADVSEPHVCPNIAVADNDRVLSVRAVRRTGDDTAITMSTASSSAELSDHSTVTGTTRYGTASYLSPTQSAGTFTGIGITNDLDTETDSVVASIALHAPASAASLDIELGIDGTSQKRGSPSTDLDLELQADGAVVKRGEAVAPLDLDLELDLFGKIVIGADVDLPIEIDIDGSTSKSAQAGTTLDIGLGFEGVPEKQGVSASDIDLEIDIDGDSSKSAEASSDLAFELDISSFLVTTTDSSLELELELEGLVAKSGSAASGADLELGLAAAATKVLGSAASLAITLDLEIARVISAIRAEITGLGLPDLVQSLAFTEIATAAGVRNTSVEANFGEDIVIGMNVILSGATDTVEIDTGVSPSPQVSGSAIRTLVEGMGF